MADDTAEQRIMLNVYIPDQVKIVGLAEALNSARTLFWIALVLVVLSQVMSIFAHDNTDLPGEHSGLNPLTDALTGCQYLETRNGVTPRLSSTGRPMCSHG